MTKEKAEQIVSMLTEEEKVKLYEKLKEIECNR